MGVQYTPQILQRDLAELYRSIIVDYLLPFADKPSTTRESLDLTAKSLQLQELMVEAGIPRDDPVFKQLERIAAESFAVRTCD